MNLAFIRRAELSKRAWELTHLAFDADTKGAHERAAAAHRVAAGYDSHNYHADQALKHEAIAENPRLCHSGDGVKGYDQT